MWAIPCYIGEGEGIRIETTRENALRFGAAIALTVECKVSLITDPPAVVFARRHGNPIAVQVDIDHERKWYTAALPYTVLKDTGRWLPFTVDGTKWRLAAQRALNYSHVFTVDDPHLQHTIAEGYTLQVIRERFGDVLPYEKPEWLEAHLAKGSASLFVEEIDEKVVAIDDPPTFTINDPFTFSLC